MNPRALVATLSPVLFFLPATHGAVANPPTPNVPAFYGDPPDQHHPWGIHDRNRPQPKRVEPGTFSSANQPGQPPSDAVVLFDGTPEALAKWEADTREGGPTKWIVKDGAMECVPKSGYIRTKQHFGDCQVHVEWAAPSKVEGNSQGRGNSGIFLMGLAEIQVLDNYNNPTYSDGFAGSLYGINPPLANALRPPGEFQVVDIVFRRPIFRDNKLVDPGYVTVFVNGVLVQDHTPLEGPGGHLRRSVPRPFPEKGPLRLQDHGNPVRFRNIWIRELPPRPIEGGTDGALTAEATAAKRKEIAAAIRADAARLPGDSLDHMLRLAESLVYVNDPAVYAQVAPMFDRYVASVKNLPPAQLEQRKAEIRNVTRIAKYLAKHGIAPANFAPIAPLDRIEKAQGWDKEKK